MRATQQPAGGRCDVYRCGDVLTLDLRVEGSGEGLAFVRTNLQRAGVQRREIIERVEEHSSVLARDWHDIPMKQTGPGEFQACLPLLETGVFEAKALFVPEGGKTLWPAGKNLKIKVLSAASVCGNSIYTVFPRQFGMDVERSDELVRAEALLDGKHYAVIPPSGTFRDVIGRLDLIMGDMGFRIIQLLPVHPVPTTYARMGRYGSPFASRDFYGVDPAMAEFDRTSTPMEQFCELVDAVHGRGGFVFIDLPANHTGWASWLQLHHPEWFERLSDGSFVNPGAWGVVWEDLCKLSFENRALWAYLADVFLYWCGRGVDGFRCDAGYMIPVAVWAYVTAKVREQYPDTVFMLEGLGGSTALTEELLVDGGMDWAYSELFQSLTAASIRHCVALTARQSSERGLMVHFAETHDNARLGAVSTRYSRFRCSLAALLSHEGGFGITNGVEWYASVKVDVHGASPIGWGAVQNQVQHLQQLLRLGATHPAFGAHSQLKIISGGDDDVLGCVRRAPHGETLLILANIHAEKPRKASWRRLGREGEGGHAFDLVSGDYHDVTVKDGKCSCLLYPETVLCMDVNASAWRVPATSGEPPASIQQRWRLAALEVTTFLRGYAGMDPGIEATIGLEFQHDPTDFLRRQSGLGLYSPSVVWRVGRDHKRLVMVPPGHVLTIESEQPFRADLRAGTSCVARRVSLPVTDGRHMAFVCSSADDAGRDLTLHVATYGSDVTHLSGPVKLLPASPPDHVAMTVSGARLRAGDVYALCTDDLGAMAQVRGHWGEIASQYDALLAVNDDPDVPVDRCVVLTRLRAWVVYRDYSQFLNAECQTAFGTDLNNRVFWEFAVPVGMGQLIALRIVLTMATAGNRVSVCFERSCNGSEDYLADAEPVRIIIRPDIEDRLCHDTTRAWTGPEQRFREAAVAEKTGFRFRRQSGRDFCCTIDHGAYAHEPEWQYLVGHPLEAGRGLPDAGDLFSPGYFHGDVVGGEALCLRAGLEGESRASEMLPAPFPKTLPFMTAASRALRRFVVRRNQFHTVIAGYPWFLDWGRDTLICLRGIVSAGMLDEARGIIGQFARFERDGTLPNMIRGNDDRNRDTSDAPFWLSVAVRDILDHSDDNSILDDDCDGRPLRDVLVSIANGVLRGTPNGIRVDPGSGLVYSPAHFTWMDTNYPAATPRQGYPIEIQALWFAALSLLQDVTPESGPWQTLADQVAQSVLRLYRSPDDQGLRDCLHAASASVPAAAALPDDACRPNQLLAVTLGLVSDPAVGSAVLRACAPLLVRGGIRSLADAPVETPVPVYRDGVLLNDPLRPYWGRYEGDEDTRRKPSYHNGTAWSWLYPSYAEALVLVYGQAARPAACSLLGALAATMESGCLGHLAEIVDGDQPHSLRGCGAQAWGVAELLRVRSSLRVEEDVEPVGQSAGLRRSRMQNGGVGDEG